MECNLEKSSYICPYCHALAGMEKSRYRILSCGTGGFFLNSYEDRCFIAERGCGGDGEINGLDELTVVTCRACHKIQLWINHDMVYPDKSNIQMASKDMPENVKEIYDEAVSVFGKSPRASAALLRLGVQLLCKELGGTGENINDDIAFLVKNGLSIRIQRALDSIRVIGNNAVHPGNIDFNDSTDIALSLFRVLNFIVEEMITKPKEIDLIYESLPPNAIKAIEKRDK